MTQRLLGEGGSKRRRRTYLFLPLVAVVALILALTGSAANTVLVGFEIDGDLPAATNNGTSVDWVSTGNSGLDSASSALKCFPAAATCAPTVPDAGLITNVIDGSG